MTETNSTGEQGEFQSIAEELSDAAHRKTKGKEEMMDSNDLRLRRLLTIMFAIMSGFAAVSTAVAPSIVHI